MSWLITTLSEVSDFIRNGVSIKQSDDASGLPITRIETIAAKKFNFEKCGYANIQADEYKDRRMQYGDILISHINSEKHLGKCAIFESNRTDIIHGMNLLCLRTNEKVHPKFVFYYLSSQFFLSLLPKITKKSVNQASFTVTHYKDLPIPLPPLPVQKQIAAVLEKADTLRNQCQQMEQELNALAQSVFLDMFGDPVTNTKGWDVKKFENHIEYIGDIGSNGSNATISANLEMLDDESYALMVRTTNFNKKDFTDNVKYVSKKTYDFFKKSQIFGGEIVMNKIGSAGQFWIMPELNKPVSLGLNQFVIRLKNLNTDYLFYYLSTEFGQKIIQSKLNGATTKSITKGAVKELPLMLPPIELQEKFSEFIQKNKALTPNKLQAELEGNFNSLMQRAFKGELELKGVA